MRRLRRAWRVPALAVVFVSATLTLGLTSVTSPAAHAASTGVAPNATGELDCNGLSPIQHPVKSAVMCKDPRGTDHGRFEENGKYIGHDEPSMRFVSNQPGSGNDVTFIERLPLEPRALPTVGHPGRDVTHTFELTIAPWYSMTVCDPQSAPQNPCTPGSDVNAPAGNYPGAGAAFVELQFYPPGFAPFTDNISCDDAHWCSALNIDSLECSGSGFAPTGCNQNCVEPVNFAFVQTNGVPAGPPSPELSDDTTFTPNRQTLMMNPGDLIKVRMFDAAIPGGHALETQETDLSTGQSGFMIASAANGFMNTSITDCSGTPFNFQPEYNTARAQNVIPWGFGPYMINSQFEIGHFEPCSSLVNPVTDTGDTFYTNCVGPYDSSSENSALESDDAPCYPFGDTHGGTAAPNLVTGCDVFNDAIGDLDYDGTPYYPDWPDSVTPDRFPSTFLQLQPTTGRGQRYPQIQFVTDNSATQFVDGCDPQSGQNCVLPAPGPGNFYPYFTQARVGGVCVWEFGNVRNGNTFGGDKQWGSVGPTTLGAFASAVQPNPNCGHAR
ncbi:MAG TPA: hypothetical protein VKU77_03310 [Streptosporangiaceae bacterium]|nr:hypothetical protein [Streptosporangiaceae bacterium]